MTENEKCDCPAEAGAASCEAVVTQGPRGCPECGNVGKAVDLVTVKSMLAIPLSRIGEPSYLFCRTAGCPLVYFGASGRQRFAEAELRERVHQKHPDDPDVFACYCFRHTPGSIRGEMERTGRSSVVESINDAIKAGKCACEIRNPQGSCCLGNVRTAVKRAGAVRSAGESRPTEEKASTAGLT